VVRVGGEIAVLPSARLGMTPESGPMGPPSRVTALVLCPARDELLDPHAPGRLELLSGRKAPDPLGPLPLLRSEVLPELPGFGGGSLGHFRNPWLKFVPLLVCCTNLAIVMQYLFWDKYTMNGAQVRMARAALKMNVRDLAAAAEVSPNTITRIEADLPSNASTVAAVRRALEAAGVEFTNGSHPGVRLVRDPGATPAAKPARRKKVAAKAIGLAAAPKQGRGK
jgi:transcriptional regulator with XRE-family HTH domain